MGTRENARARFDRCLRESDKILSDLMAARPDLAGEFTPVFWQAPSRPEEFAPDEAGTTVALRSAS